MYRGFKAKIVTVSGNYNTHETTKSKIISYILYDMKNHLFPEKESEVSTL